MGLPATKLSIDEFLAWENEQPDRHEFYRGDVFAMVGARRVHGHVVVNLVAALKSHLRGSACRAFVNEQKIQVQNQAIFYPDLFVTCDRHDLATETVFRCPVLVVEVQSPSTTGYDHALKFIAYRTLESLQEYVMVDPDSRRVEVYRRNERNRFELVDQTGDASLILTSVELQMPMADVFEDVEGSPVTAA